MTGGTALGRWLLRGAARAGRGPEAPAPGAGGGAAPLYPTHQRLSRLQKAAVTAAAAAGAVLMPQRADLVGALGETTGGPALRRMRDRMRATESGRRVLVERPRVTAAAVGRAWDLPPHTFGGAYARFMGARDFSPDDRPPVRFVDDEELAYVALRARETHDFWHVLFGCNTTILGELALKSVEFVQTGLPMCALAVAGAQFRLNRHQRNLLWTTYVPWSVHAGARSADLVSLYYEEHLEADLEDLRRRWRITPAPKPPGKAKAQAAAATAV